LSTAPPRNRDVAALVQPLQHLRDLPASPPAVSAGTAIGSGRSIFELAREQRPAPLQLAEDVAAESGVLPQEVVPAPLPGKHACAAIPPHQRPDQRQRLDGPDERVPLEQLPLHPEEPIQLAGVERAEPAPEDELLGGRDGRDRIDLEETEPTDGLKQASCRPIQQLGADGDPSRLLLRHFARSDGNRSQPFLTP
jgi:hypothetical protein